MHSHRRSGHHRGRHRSALALILSFALAACATTSGASPFDGPPGQDDSVQFTIDNQNFYDATVWALWEGGVRQRLGSVTGNTSRTFSSRHRSNGVRFEVDFLAGGDYVTNGISVAPGDHIQLRIRPGGG